MTPGSAVKAYCLWCLSAETGRQAYDCLASACPLYPAHPFRGRPVPRKLTPTERVDEVEGIQEAALIPKRRPSTRLIRARCYDCQPGTHEDCQVDDCQLYAYRPWKGPGHKAKSALKVKQGVAAAHRLHPAARMQAQDPLESSVTPK